MRKWDTDKILGAGLIIALLVKIVGDVIITLYGLTTPSSDLTTNIVACLAGYMGRSLAEKLKQKGDQPKTPDTIDEEKTSEDIP